MCLISNKKNTNREEKQIKEEETESSVGEVTEEIKDLEPEEKNLRKELDIKTSIIQGHYHGY